MSWAVKNDEEMKSCDGKFHILPQTPSRYQHGECQERHRCKTYAGNRLGLSMFHSAYGWLFLSFARNVYPGLALCKRTNNPKGDRNCVEYRDAPHIGAAQILEQTLGCLKEEKTMQADRVRLTKACCSPSKYASLDGAPLPTTIQETPARPADVRRAETIMLIEPFVVRKSICPSAEFFSRLIFPKPL
jgi:hypothetical protein